MSNGDATADEMGDKQATLFAYRDTKGRALAAATLLIPFGTVILFVAICLGGGDEYALDSVVEITTVMRVTLIAHGLYFIVLPFSFELKINDVPGIPGFRQYNFGKIPPRPDNGYWMMTCLCGELFFVAAVIFLLMATQSNVPRWTFLGPIAQCAYNMKNDLIWVGFGNTLSPIKQRVTIMIIDWLYIGACFIVYIITFFTANAV